MRLHRVNVLKGHDESLEGLEVVSRPADTSCDVSAAKSTMQIKQVQSP